MKRVRLEPANNRGGPQGQKGYTERHDPLGAFAGNYAKDRGSYPPRGRAIEREFDPLDTIMTSRTVACQADIVLHLRGPR